MKKSFLTFLAVVALCLNMNAQRGKKGTKTRERTPAPTEQSTKSQKTKAPQSFNPRNDRQIAIVSDSGLKSMTGLGLSASYYATKNVAIDAGIGLGFGGVKTGVRGRYLFLDKKFTPYVGAGIFRSLSNVEDVLITSVDGSDDYFVDIEASTFAQGIVGFEFMGDGGFVIGFHLGYSSNLNKSPWFSNDNIDPDTVTVLDFLYGSGLATGLRIGYAF